MKINKDSWHYRLNAWWSPGMVPNNLCGYFWSTIFFSVLSAGAAATLALFAVGALMPVIQPLWKHFVDPSQSLELAVIIGVAEIFVLMILGFTYLKKKSSFVRVFIKYLAAKKRKICPLIKFVEKK